MTVSGSHFTDGRPFVKREPFRALSAMFPDILNLEGKCSDEFMGLEFIWKFWFDYLSFERYNIGVRR